MHLRAPSIDQGVHAFAWSVVFFLYMWLGALAIEVSGGIAFIVSLIAAAQALAEGEPQCRWPDLSLSAATRRSAKSRPIACSRRSSAGSFGVLPTDTRAEASARIRFEAAGATVVSTAVLMERASALALLAVIPGGSERRGSGSFAAMLSL